MTARARKSPAATAARPARTPRVTPERLMQEAERVLRFAHAPYSQFPVGAALLTADGRVITGCNVENSSFGLSICAERNALFHAVAVGERAFVAIAVTAGPRLGASPCGACRQVLHEFAPRLKVYWRDAKGRIVERRLDRLLADAFDFDRRSAR